MPKKSSHKKSSHSFILVASISLIILISLWFFLQRERTNTRQATLQPFYDTTNISPGQPGDLIRYEPMDITIPYGKAYRILYHSDLASGTPTITSGMLFIPTNDPPHEGRDVIAWAHGTIGMGPSCAPSRSTSPTSKIGGLSEMLQAGYIVTATDYYGLGTPGIEHYLLGDDEARDVINAVRAARQFPQTQVTHRFALWGSSQGGHAVLFAAHVAKEYAPELQLVAAAAAAPATELSPLMSAQYHQAASWVIGPELAVAWPLKYTDLPLNGILTTTALQNYQRLAYTCVTMASIEGILRNTLGESFFTVNPSTNPSWHHALQDQTPQPILETPLFIAQGLTDTVVLPTTTARYAKRSCDAGANLTMDWIPNVSHLETAKTAGPAVVSWLEQRFADIPAKSNCDQPLPILPAN